MQATSIHKRGAGFAKARDRQPLRRLETEISHLICLLFGITVVISSSAFPALAADSPDPKPPPPAPALAIGPLPGEARQAGAALRRARVAARSGLRDEALLGVRALHEAEPALRDLIAWFEAVLWLERGEDELSRLAVERGLLSGPPRHLRVRLERLRGDLAQRAGDEEAARAAWRRALRGAREPELRAELQLALASSLERSGAVERAGLAYRKLWRGAPAEAAARRAAARLAALERSAAVPLPSAGDWLGRADRLFAKRRSEEALAAYEQVDRARPDATEEQRERAAMGRGRCLFRLRRYPEAVAAFAALPDGGWADFWEARSLARSGRVRDSIAAFEHLAETARGRLGQRARYLAGLLHQGRGRRAAARAHFAAVLRATRVGSLAEAALWQLAWGDYRAGDYGTARRRFRDLRGRLEDPIEALRPRYWAARALEEASPGPAARTELLAIAREYPLSYYGWQAARRLAEPRLEPAPNPPRDTALRDTGSSLAPERLYRAQVLIAAELDELARTELIALRSAARRPRDRIAVAALQARLGEHNDAFRTVVVPYERSLARGVESGLEALWQLAWPRPWPELVSDLRELGLESAVIWSVMREESGYRPDVISVTGARGLLQIMPETGAQLARRAGTAPYRDALLLNPSVNIKFGATYLLGLFERFGGDLAAAIAGYNAGPGAVASWRPEGGVADDVWIESIPYQQTRGYVKRVLRSVAVYRQLYPRDARLPAAAASRDPGVGGVRR